MMERYMPERFTIPAGTSGAWRIEHFEVTEHESAMSTIRGWRRRVEPGTYTRLRRDATTVMSDTRAEIMDLWEFRRLATKGRILINGLGLGVATRIALSYPNVTEVTVVERSPDVIALVAPHITDARLTVVEGDAFDYKPTGRYAVVWHDIWDDICTENLQQMSTLHRRFGRAADWQGSWCRDECERIRADERRRFERRFA